MLLIVLWVLSEYVNIFVYCIRYDLLPVLPVIIVLFSQFHSFSFFPFGVRLRIVSPLNTFIVCIQLLISTVISFFTQSVCRIWLSLFFVLLPRIHSNSLMLYDAETQHANTHTRTALICVRIQHIFRLMLLCSCLCMCSKKKNDRAQQHHQHQLKQNGKNREIFLNTNTNAFFTACQWANYPTQV